MSETSQRGFAPVILLFLVALIAVGAGAYFYGKGNLKLPTEKTASSGAQVSVTPSPAVDETANWKTYTGNDYSFKYPTEWSVDSSSTTSTVLYINATPPPSNVGEGYAIPQLKDSTHPEKYAKISVSFVGEKSTSVETTASQWRTGKVESTQVDAHPAAKILQSPSGQEGPDFMTSSYTLSVFVKNNAENTYLLQLETPSTTLYTPIFEQFLSTFKFTQ